MKLGRILVTATLSLLAACSSDSPTEVPTGNASGTVSFTYSGGGTGSYSATGAISSSANTTTGRTTTWAAGYKVSSTNSTNVMANMARAGGISDMVIIILNRQTTGTGTINTTCQPTASATCNVLAFVIGASGSGSTEAFAFNCVLVSGTITVASISSSNAAGSFSGSGMCVNGTTFASSTFSVTNGSFNVPLLTNVPGIT